MDLNGSGMEGGWDGMVWNYCLLPNGIACVINVESRSLVKLAEEWKKIVKWQYLCGEWCAEVWSVSATTNPMRVALQLQL